MKPALERAGFTRCRLGEDGTPAGSWRGPGDNPILERIGHCPPACWRQADHPLTASRLKEFPSTSRTVPRDRPARFLLRFSRSGRLPVGCHWRVASASEIACAYVERPRSPFAGLCDLRCHSAVTLSKSEVQSLSWPLQCRSTSLARLTAESTASRGANGCQLQRTWLTTRTRWQATSGTCRRNRMARGSGRHLPPTQPQLPTPPARPPQLTESLRKPRPQPPAPPQPPRSSTNCRQRVKIDQAAMNRKKCE